MAKVGVQDTLQQSGVNLENEGVALADTIVKISNLIRSTQDVWEGNASQQYQEQWTRLEPQFKQAAENVQELGRQIKAYYEQIKGIDDQASSTFSK